jgi:hypothetical protein
MRVRLIPMWLNPSSGDDHSITCRTIAHPPALSASSTVSFVGARERRESFGRPPGPAWPRVPMNAGAEQLTRAVNARLVYMERNGRVSRAAGIMPLLFVLGACSSARERPVGEWREQSDPAERIRFHPDTVVTYSNQLGTISGLYEVRGDQRIRLKHPFGTTIHTFGSRATSCTSSPNRTQATRRSTRPFLNANIA